MEKLVYSIREAAEVLGVSKSYLYLLVKQKEIPSLQLGKRRVIPKTYLEQWIQENVNM